MAGRQLARALLAVASRPAASMLASSSLPAAAVSGSKLLSNVLGFGSMLPSNSSSCAFHSSNTASQEAADKAPTLYEPSRKYRSLADKELWHEAWMYEDRFGTEASPIIVPSLEGERIIGVTDPEDDNLVVWGILREGDSARQFIEGGEFYVLKKVPYVAKVGDVLEAIEGGSAKPISK